MSELYYADDLVTLYQGSCLEHTAWAEADVLVTDPPYGMRYRSGWRRDSTVGDISGDRDTEVRDAALQLWGIERAAVVFGHWSASPPAGERGRLIWAKGDWPGMGDLSIPWGPAHEEIHIIGRTWDRESTGLKRAGSVITTAGGRGGGARGAVNELRHATPKPIALMEYLIARCPAGVIAEPFAGSGATVVAARNLGRRVVAVELEEAHCAAIVDRLRQDALDFVGSP